MLGDAPILTLKKNLCRPTKKQVSSFKGAQTGNIVDAMGGMEALAGSLSTAFSDPSTGITAAMSGSVGMISGAISGKAPKEKNAVTMGMETKDSAAASIWVKEYLKKSKLKEETLVFGNFNIAFV